MSRRRAKIIRFPIRLAAAPTRKGALVEVHRAGQAEAVVVRGLLESEGIPTFARSRLAHSVHPFTIGGQGEIVILVPESEAPRARELVALRRPLIRRAR
jgi:hypothetical protein